MDDPSCWSVLRTQAAPQNPRCRAGSALCPPVYPRVAATRIVCGALIARISPQVARAESNGGTVSASRRGTCEIDHIRIARPTLVRAHKAPVGCPCGLPRRCVTGGEEVAQPDLVAMVAEEH